MPQKRDNIYQEEIILQGEDVLFFFLGFAFGERNLNGKERLFFFFGFLPGK